MPPISRLHLGYISPTRAYPARIWKHARQVRVPFSVALWIETNSSKGNRAYGVG